MPAYLARRYAAAVTVERRDGEPASFEWRGRHYAVRSVLDHWWETRAWWMSALDAPPGDVRIGDDEHEMWRVEAAAVTGGGVAIVELGFAWETGRWTIHALLD